MAELELLMELARSGTHLEPRQITSGDIARKFGISQQTASRWLIELDTKGLIKRSPEGRKHLIQLTPKGVAKLRSLHHELNQLFERRKPLRMGGRVISGLGEGSYYLGQSPYLNKIREKLGFTPYPGTLDLKLNGKSKEIKTVLEGLEGIKIEGFSTPERSFGELKCFPCKIGKLRAGMVIPSRTHFTDVIEIIAPQHLRDRLKLKDGDEVEVEVMA